MEKYGFFETYPYLVKYGLLICEISVGSVDQHYPTFFKTWQEQFHCFFSKSISIWKSSKMYKMCKIFLQMHHFCKMDTFLLSFSSLSMQSMTPAATSCRSSCEGDYQWHWHWYWQKQQHIDEIKMMRKVTNGPAGMVIIIINIDIRKYLYWKRKKHIDGIRMMRKVTMTRIF